MEHSNMTTVDLDGGAAVTGFAGHDHHPHDGHDHGHNHSHSHNHSHHAHDHGRDHAHSHGHSHGGHDHHHDHSHDHDHDHDHGHGHDHHHHHHDHSASLPKTSLPSVASLIGHLASARQQQLLWTLAHFVVTLLVFAYGHQHESLALQAYAYYMMFDSLGYGSILVSHLLEGQVVRASGMYSFGAQRFEVALGFANALVLMFSGMYALKESLELVLQPPEHEEQTIHINLLVPAALLVFNLGGMLRFRNHSHFLQLLEQAQLGYPKYTQPSNAHSAKSIAEAVSAIFTTDWVSQFRHNLFVRGHVMMVVTVFVVQVIEILGQAFVTETLPMVEPMAACVQGVIMMWLSYPIAVETGKILLCTTPKGFLSLIDKQTREMSTLEGVLEVRNVHFWCVSFGSYAGTMHVRVRRDADEQQVRSRIHRKLKDAGLMAGRSGYGMRPLNSSPLASTLSVSASMSPFYSPASSASSINALNMVGHSVDWCIQVVKDQW
ncbi:hypothetical protein RI367_005991 [Sorochytrium milnesiophthora]